VEDRYDDVWTWYDHRELTLRQVLVGLCAPWGVVPRIIRSRAWGLASQLLARPLEVPQPLLWYAEPWTSIDPRVLDELPRDLPACAEDYVEQTGEALRQRATIGLAA
jgi:hypothetical protein